jgi:hypothetical protein
VIFLNDSSQKRALLEYALTGKNTTYSFGKAALIEKRFMLKENLPSSSSQKQSVVSQIRKHRKNRRERKRVFTEYNFS